MQGGQAWRPGCPPWVWVVNLLCGAQPRSPDLRRRPVSSATTTTTKPSLPPVPPTRPSATAPASNAGVPRPMVRVVPTPRPHSPIVPHRFPCHRPFSLRRRPSHQPDRRHHPDHQRHKRRSDPRRPPPASPPRLPAHRFARFGPRQRSKKVWIRPVFDGIKAVKAASVRADATKAGHGIADQTQKKITHNPPFHRGIVPTPSPPVCQAIA